MSNNKTAIVTGAGKGIGAALAKRLAADGFSVIVNYSSSAGEANEVVSAIEVAGGRAKAVRADVVDPAQVRSLFDLAEKEFGSVDVLVNNAGILKVAPLAQVSDEDFHRQVSVNLTGAFNGMREGARRIRDGGRIISLSTSIIGNYLPAHGVYVATKAAIEGMTHVLAKELGPEGILTNVVMPGLTLTEAVRHSMPQAVEQAAKVSPIRHVPTSEEVASVVVFVASAANTTINGEVIRVNGGAVA